LTTGDHVGLFRQRPSQRWGMRAQLLDPVYTSTTLYKALLHVPDWQQQPLTVDAQAVQRSAIPDTCAAWQDLATDTVNVLAGTVGSQFPEEHRHDRDDPTSVVVPMDKLEAAADQLLQPFGDIGHDTGPTPIRRTERIVVPSLVRHWIRHATAVVSLRNPPTGGPHHSTPHGCVAYVCLISQLR
jgi:hypothetical protein